MCLSIELDKKLGKMKRSIKEISDYSPSTVNSKKVFLESDDEFIIGMRIMGMHRGILSLGWQQRHDSVYRKGLKTKRDKTRETRNMTER